MLVLENINAQSTKAERINVLDGDDISTGLDRVMWLGE